MSIFVGASAPSCAEVVPAKIDSGRRMTCYLPRLNMKKTFRFFIALIATAICVSAANAGDVQVEAYITNGTQDEAATWFAPNTPNILAIFKTKGLKEGDKLRGVLVAEDVGDAAPANTKVLEKTLDMEVDTDAGEFKFIKPTDGWPVGTYHVEIYVNDELATKIKFTIKAAKSKKHAEEEEKESSDDE